MRSFPVTLIRIDGGLLPAAGVHVNEHALIATSLVVRLADPEAIFDGWLLLFTLLHEKVT